jgi:formylglycine-generating enzyme required for sulfatase activity
MPLDEQALLGSYATTGTASGFRKLAQHLEGRGNLRAAASAYDQAYSLTPDDPEIARARQALLDRLAITEHGLCFRYIPAGSFVMGSDSGDPDEAPVHVVTLGDYWLSETPVSWAAYCTLMGWEPPPRGQPTEINPLDKDKGRFFLAQCNKIRLQYCENATIRARDWHAHAPSDEWQSGGRTIPARDLFGEPARDDPERPWGYDDKPMVSVSWQEAEELCARLSTEAVVYRLPTEAEWEKGARGGLVGCPYPWGPEPPDAARCDYNRFEQFSILPSKRLPPNGYGLYAVSGGVWEWTADWYDAESYREAPPEDPRGPETGTAKVLRGGSWADCADAVTVSFRMARECGSWRDAQWSGAFAPNVGFRLCRAVTPSARPASPR